MARRTPLVERVSQNVSGAIAAAGFPISVVAEAADLTSAELQARLDGVAEFNTAELVMVGGFLRIRPSSFMGVAA